MGTTQEIQQSREKDIDMAKRRAPIIVATVFVIYEHHIWLFVFFYEKNIPCNEKVVKHDIGVRFASRMVKGNSI